MKSFLPFFLCLMFSPAVSLTQTGIPLTIGEGTAPAIDGVLSAGEWADAATVHIPSISGTVYVKHDGTHLYVAFRDAQRFYQSSGIYIDRLHDGGASPQADDVWIHGSAGPFEFAGDGGAQWQQATPSGWSYRSSTAAEYEVSLEKLGITDPDGATLGILFSFLDWSMGQAEVTWPEGGYPNVADPDTWATAQLTTSTTGITGALPTDAGFDLYPNPARGTLTIDCASDLPAELRITRIDGRLVRRTQLRPGEAVLDVRDLSPGHYLVAVSDRRGVTVRRVALR